MRKIIWYIFITVLAIACSEKNTVVVTGKIANSLEENVVIRINYFDELDTIKLNVADGTFFTEIDLKEEHFGWLYHERIAFPLYLIPGATINLEFDAEDLKIKSASNIQITGEGSETTAFLYSLNVKSNKYGNNDLLKMPVDSFAMVMNDAEQFINGEIEKFKANNSPSDEFMERTILRQKVNLALKYSNFIKYHSSYSPEDKTPIPDSFRKIIDGIPLNDTENCKEIIEYRYFLIQNHQDKIDEEMQSTNLERISVAYVNKNADKIAALVAPQDIKDDIGKRFLYYYYKRPDSIRKVYKARYKEVIRNQEYINEFEKTVATLKKLKSGNVAPTFNYPDINGEMISSESLKGKVIYIDVWATWCSPCIYEIPYLNKLEEELHKEEIAFVSISVDDNKDKEAWKKMVKEKELGGYQLYAKGGWESKIIEDYVIQGIPYFIIIDKEGKLVEIFATRPSNPETKEKLLELAQN